MIESRLHPRGTDSETHDQSPTNLRLVQAQHASAISRHKTREHVVEDRQKQLPAVNHQLFQAAVQQDQHSLDTGKHTSLSLSSAVPVLECFWPFQSPLNLLPATLAEGRPESKVQILNICRRQQGISA